MLKDSEIKKILREATSDVSRGSLILPLQPGFKKFEKTQLSPFTQSVSEYDNSELAYDSYDGKMDTPKNKIKGMEKKAEKISNWKKKHPIQNDDDGDNINPFPSKINEWVEITEDTIVEDLAVWFGKKKKPKGSSQPKGPWVNICKKVDGKHPPCGRENATDKSYPKCRAAGVAGKMSDSQKRAACAQKRRAEKTHSKSGTGNKPKMVSYKPRKTNEDLERLVKKILKEQIGPTGDVSGDSNRYKATPPNANTTPIQDMTKKFLSQKIDRFPCVPENLRIFVSYVIDNSEKLMKELGVDYKMLILLTKASLGIIGRESKFGSFMELSDFGGEFVRKIGLGSLLDLAFEKMTGGKKTQSLGIAQFTPETWKRFGLDKTIGDYNTSFSILKQGLGVLYSLNQRYKKALSIGLKTQPSQNPLIKKYLNKEIKGTGNHALDMSILSHNMVEDKTITKYCTTNHPLYFAPCNKSTYEPFKNKESFNPSQSTILKLVKDENLKKFPGLLNVNTNDIVPNFFPNLKGPSHTAIGYVEEVTKYINTFNCF